MSQSDRDINRQFKKCLHALSVDHESCPPLLMGELQSSIKRMKGKGAAGPSNIPPSFLKSLGPLALQEYYPYSTHHFHLLIFHKSEGLPLSFHYSKLRNLLVKSHLSVSSASHAPSNFWNVFLLTISTILPKPTTCSVDSRLVFINDGAMKVRLLK